MRTISICIPTWNRFAFTINSVKNVLEDQRVSEIIISDDNSNDGSYEQLIDYFKPFPKVKLFRNDKNQGCYRNKMIAASLATNPWVIIFDSDNEMPVSYLDAIFAIDPWDDHTVYQPEFAMPHFNFCHLRGLTVTKQNVREFLNDRMASTLINAMNYFVNKNLYLNVFDYGFMEPWAADSIIQNYNWLNAGNSIYIVPNMRYTHTVHDHSHFKQHQNKSLTLAKIFEDKLKQLK